MANKKVSQLTSKSSVLLTDLFPIADPSTGQLYKITISDLGTAIGSGVSSVNGLVGAVVLDTDDIQELVSPTNKWFTDTRARAALSASSPLTYNSGTGAFGIQVASGSQNGYLSSSDWTTFNSKQAALSGTGFVKISGTTISYDNTSYLPLTGGTLTGTLNGTNISISNSLTAKGGTFNGGASGGVVTIDGLGSDLLMNRSNTSNGSSITLLTNAVEKWNIGLRSAGTTENFFIYNSNLTANSLTISSATSAATFASSVTASALYVSGMTAGNGAIYHTSSRLTFANYNASGTLHFEVNGGAGALTLNADKSATFEAGGSFAGALSGTSGTFTLAGKDALVVSDSTTQAAGVGGSILFKGVYTNGGSPLNFGRIALEKQNSTNADYSFNLAFYTSPNGGANPNTTAALKLNYDNSATFSSSVSATSLLVNGSTVTSELLSIQSSQAKTYTTQVALSRWHTNESSGSQFKLNLFVIGNATSSSRVFKFQTSNEGVANDGVIALQSDGGNVGINTTSPGLFPLAVQAQSSALGIGIIGRSDGYGEFHFRNNANSSTYAYIQGQPGSILACVAGNSGGVYLQSGGVAWLSVSDERLKTNLNPIENAISKVSQLRAMTGRYKTDSNNISRAFLIAQDVLDVLPEAVNLNENTGMYGVSYTEVIPLLVASIKELKSELDTLKNK